MRWIVGLLWDRGIPCQAVGGLAARAYGAARPLVDLDFYIPTDRLGDVSAAASAHVVGEPIRHVDASWDLVFMKLDYEGCTIELGGAEAAPLFDRHAGRWRDVEIDFSRSIETTVLGVRIPTMPCDQLVEYTSALDRDVDRQDIDEVTAWPSN